MKHARGGHSVLHLRPGSRHWSSGQGRKLEQSKGQGEFQLVKMVQRSTSGGCGFISFEVGQGQLLGVVKRSRPKIGGQES